MYIQRYVLAGISALTCVLHQATAAPAEEGVSQTHAQQTKQNAQCRVEQIKAVPPEQQTFANTFQPWMQLGCDLCAAFEAPAPVQKLHKELAGLFFQDTALYHHLVSYLQKAIADDHLTIDEQWAVYGFLENSKNIKANLSEADREVLDELRAFYVMGEKKPWVYHDEDYSVEDTSQESWRILSANAAFLPDSSADMLCLWGVFADETASALREGLKGEYAVFYLGTTPHPEAASLLKQLGFSTRGLFVATKNLATRTDIASRECTIETTSLSTKEGNTGLLTTIRKMDASIVLCGGSAEVNVRQDSDGNTSAGGSVDYKKENGSASVGVEAEVSRDSQGNVSGSVEGSLTVTW